MSLYTWVSNIDKSDQTSVISFVSGTVIERGHFADLSALEVARLRQFANVVDGKGSDATPGFDPLTAYVTLGQMLAAISGLGGGSSLTPTAVKTANYTALPGELVRVDTTGGPVTITAPVAAPGASFGIKIIAYTVGNPVTIARQGSDVFNKTGGVTSVAMNGQDTTKQLIGASGLWVIASGDLTIPYLNTLFQVIGSGADITAPTVPVVNPVAPGNAQNVITWSASTDAVGVAGYHLRRDGTVIYTGTALTFTDTGRTNGTAYGYTVDAYDAAGNTSAQSSSVSGTPTAGNVAPTVTTAPTTSGSTALGNVLTGSAGTYAGTPSPTFTSRRWQRSANGTTGWADISGATATTYTIVSADQGAYVRYAEQYDNTAGSITGYSSAVTVPAAGSLPVNTAAPTTSVASGGGSGGQATGCVLQGAGDTWSGGTVTSRDWQWVRHHVPYVDVVISGATSSTYTTTLADEGFEIIPRVRATNASGTAASYTNATAGIRPLPGRSVIREPNWATVGPGGTAVTRRGGRKVGMLGHSLGTFGNQTGWTSWRGVGKPGTWASSSILGWACARAGAYFDGISNVSGTLTADWVASGNQLAQWDALPSAKKPDILWVQYPTNDLNTSISTIQTNLTTIIDKAHSWGTRVILDGKTPRGSSASPNYSNMKAIEDMVITLCANKGASFVDWYDRLRASPASDPATVPAAQEWLTTSVATDGGAAGPYCQSDTLHQSALGGYFMGDMGGTVLRAMLSATDARLWSSSDGVTYLNPNGNMAGNAGDEWPTNTNGGGYTGGATYTTDPNVVGQVFNVPAGAARNLNNNGTPYPFGAGSRIYFACEQVSYVAATGVNCRINCASAGDVIGSVIGGSQRMPTGYIVAGEFELAAADTGKTVIATGSSDVWRGGRLTVLDRTATGVAN